jgi:hypothetical protein
MGVKVRGEAFWSATENNVVVLSDGQQSIKIGRQMVLSKYTVAEVLGGTPSPGKVGAMIWCTDTAGGPRILYSDGGAWLDLRTGLPPT